MRALPSLSGRRRAKRASHFPKHRTAAHCEKISLFETRIYEQGRGDASCYQLTTIVSAPAPHPPPTVRRCCIPPAQTASPIDCHSHSNTMCDMRRRQRIPATLPTWEVRRRREIGALLHEGICLLLFNSSSFASSFSRQRRHQRRHNRRRAAERAAGLRRQRLGAGRGALLEWQPSGQLQL